ncbi:hypothetical protein REPUB_Repub16aG0024600 [Reevesia pubescens]
MGSKRSSRKKPKNCPFNFQNLISSLSSPQGLTPESMEGLYLLLLNLSCSISESNLNFSETEFNLNEFKLKFKNIHEISNVLFDKLNAKFNELFSALNDVSTNPVRAESIFHVNVKAAIKELTLLLRCCFAVFKLLVLDQKLVVEKGRIFLGILRRCVSVELKGEKEKSCTSFENEVSHECMYADDDSTTFLAKHLVTSISFSGPSNPFHTILCALLEVFADELLMHASVRQYLLLVDSLSDVNEFLFVRHFGPGNIGSVLEVISAHFILSISDDQAFKNFLNRLFWLPDNNFRVPEMTLTTALSLLLNPIMLSAPKMFQAYLVLLVSEVIGISMSFEHMIPSSELRLYLSAFERSVDLYTRHMSNLHMKGHPIVDDDSFVKSRFCSSYSHMDFECCLLPATKEKIHNLITKCENLWNPYLSNTLLKKRSDLVAASVEYTKESLQVFEESSRDEILSILSCIILRGSSDDVDDSALQKKEDTSPQDICLLASILKLMSGAMLQAIRILTQGRNSGSLKTLENVALRVKSLSCKSRIKARKSESCHKTREDLVDQKSSRAVALKFQKIQTLYLGTNSRKSFKKKAQEQEPGSLENTHIVNHVESALSIEENTGETCNGEIFLRCILEGSQNSSAIADLADFIECKQGKDYSDWLKGRQKFRQWKSEKMANFRWKKKRRIFQKTAKIFPPF